MVGEREVWVRKAEKTITHIVGPRWILSDTLPREEALKLMDVFAEQGFQVRLTTKGGAYVTDKSW
jgi:hypothetical protein